MYFVDYELCVLGLWVVLCIMMWVGPQDSYGTVCMLCLICYGVHVLRILHYRYHYISV